MIEIESSGNHEPCPTVRSPAGRWHDFADQVLGGHALSCAEALQVLDSADDDLLDLLAAAFRVRRHYFGLRVRLHFLINAKSGLCPEDCGYCSQSKDSTAEVPQYTLVDEEALLRGARMAVERKATTYCIVISARGPTQREMDAVTAVVPEIKRRHDLTVCVGLGLLSGDQAQRLKQCGVDRVNHNVNTSGNFYPQICTTHTHEDRLNTLRAVRDAGLEVCSGGIVGMGERPLDIVQMALLLRELEVRSIPINFLHPIAGTPLQGADHLNPRYCLKVLAMFRLVNPDRDLRIAGGRELHLGSLQPLGLYAANSIFLGDYLTTEGQLPEADYRMIEEMGFSVQPAR